MWRKLVVNNGADQLPRLQEGCHDRASLPLKHMCDRWKTGERGLIALTQMIEFHGLFIHDTFYSVWRAALQYPVSFLFRRYLEH